MIPPTTRRGTVSAGVAGGGGREGLLVWYGAAALAVLVLGAVSYPAFTAALLAFIGGVYAIGRKCRQVMRRRAHWTVQLPGTGVRLRIRVG